MEKTLERLVFSSLVILASGLLTSISLMAGFHLFVVPAIIIALPHFSWKKFPKSGWALLGFSVVLILSVLINQDIIAKPIKNILKVKYFLLGALSIIPLDIYFNQILSSEKKEKVLKLLFRLVLLGAVLATLSGLVGYFTGFNPLRMVRVPSERNGGVFGMLMTYGHSIAWLSVILVAMCVHSGRFIFLISCRLLIFSTFVSLLGLFTSHVRGAWFAFLAGCALVNKRLTLFLLGVLAVAVFGAQLINPSFLETQILRKTSNDERMGSWLGAIKAFQEKPLLGYGYLNFEPNSQKIKEKYHLPNSYFGGHAHNDFLEILATSGIFGVSFFLLWIFFWAREVRRKLDGRSQLVFPFIVAFLVSGLTQVTMNDGECAFFFMIVYALSVVL